MLAAVPAPAAASFRNIQHVVIIVQEARSFDNLFQGFPGADTQPYGYDSKGEKVNLQPRGFVSKCIVTPDYDYTAFLLSYDGGKMDGFDKQGSRCGSDIYKQRPTPLLTYSYVPAQETRPYFSIARQYVLADRMFSSTWDGNFEDHQILISGGQDGLTLGNPVDGQGGNEAWGCDAPTETVARISPLSSVAPCFFYPTLAGEFDANQVSWRYYSAPETDVGFEWSAFDAIDPVRYGPDWSNVRSNADFISDVQEGNLADVTWITPNLSDSDHVRGAAQGPRWVASLVNAIGESKFWPNTAIFVVWSEWGFWYDHVAPPQLAGQQFGNPDGLGMRVPMLIVSPYVPQGHVTHVQYEHGSVLKFAEEAFGLPPNGVIDARANSPAGEFDFNQQPRAFTPIRQ
jgi:phospholipase C